MATIEGTGGGDSLNGTGDGDVIYGDSLLLRLQGMSGQDDRNPQITALSDGGYVVTWRGNTSDGQGYDIFAQQYDSDGYP